VKNRTRARAPKRTRRLAALLLLPLALACGSKPKSSGPLEEGYTRPSKGEKRVLDLDLSAGAPEAIAGGGLFPLPATRTYTGLVRALEKGLAADTTAGVLVRLGSAGFDMAQVQELSSLLERFGKKGLPVVCQGDGLSNATAALFLRGCTRRYLGPAGEAETVGLAAQVVYLRSILDRLKIEVDFLHVGKFKSGPEPLLQDGPSPEAKEALDFALGSIRDGWLALAPTPETKAALEAGPFSPPEAKNRGLVHEVGYESDARDELRKLGKTTNLEPSFGPRATGRRGLDLGEIMKALLGSGDEAASSPHVAVVPMQGAIATDAGGPFGGGGISSTAMVKVLAKLARNDNVKAVVIRIDSPGGSPLASDLIWHELMRMRKKKTVIASVGGMAASGGYYIASAADRIYAEPASIVGSIGVFGGKLVLSPALKEIGITSFTFPASKAEGAAERAGYLSPLVGWDEPTRERVRSLMQGIYDLFIARVAEGRKLPAEKILPIAEGRIWSGPQGLERGLVDKLGGLLEAIADARKAAGVDPKSAVTVEGAAESILDMLSLGDGDSEESHVAAALARYQARPMLALDQLPVELRSFAATLGPLFRGESVVTALPYAITVR
jgi:protease-4